MNKARKTEIIHSYYLRLEKDVEDSINAGLQLYVLYSQIKNFSEDFKERTEAFFILFKEMLRRGHLKLQRDGEIIEHTPEEWEEIFRAAWPEYEVEPDPLPGYAPLDMSMWFITDECPAYAVWVDPETGEYEWST